MPEHADRSALLNSLYARLALGLVALVTLLGAVNLTIMLHAGRLYQQELNQQLNRSLAANLIGPVLDAGKRRAEVTRTRAVASEELHGYGQAVLNALGEVEDALALEKRRQDYIRSLDIQLELSGRTIERVRDRYIKGAEDYLRVLAALLTQQQLQRTRLSAGREIIQDRIDLCRALGGGWQLPQPVQDSNSGEK